MSTKQTLDPVGYALWRATLEHQAAEQLRRVAQTIDDKDCAESLRALADVISPPIEVDHA